MRSIAGITVVLLSLSGCMGVHQPTQPTQDYLRHVNAAVSNPSELPPVSPKPVTEDELRGKWEMSQVIVNRTTVSGSCLAPKTKKRAITIEFTGQGHCTATLWDYNREFTNEFEFKYADGKITFYGGHPDKSFWFLDASRFEVVNRGGDSFELRYVDLPLYSKFQVGGVVKGCTSEYLGDRSLKVTKFLDAQRWEYTFSPMIFTRTGGRVKAPSRAVPSKTGTAARSTRPARTGAKARAASKRVRHKAKVLYDVVALERKASGDFSYRFELRLKENVDWSIQTIKAVKHDFRKNIKDDYSESFTGASVASLFVEFPAFDFCDGRIEGCAVVMNMVVKSMNYDPLARTGHLSVVVNSNQFEETRKWIRRNIETVARDKNIALTTGEIPPAARFYLGREELKGGNVLEIEFRTE